VRCGFVAVIGRTNVGKSTLVNGFVGEKVAIVTPKPQTTRNVIRGILNEKRGQVIFLDTPGFHKPRTRMNRSMVSMALKSPDGVDAVVWMLEARRPWRDEEEQISERLKESGDRLITVINKVDKLAEKERLLPLMKKLSDLFPENSPFPMSALVTKDRAALLDRIFPLLPEGEPLFPPEVYTDQYERQLVAEIVREHVFRNTYKEVPHCVGVLVERFDEPREGGKAVIYCAVLVERDSQKPILIGRGGKNVKKIGMGARSELQSLLGCRVDLRLFVKVRPDWRENTLVLREMGLA